MRLLPPVICLFLASAASAQGTTTTVVADTTTTVAADVTTTTVAADTTTTVAADTTTTVAAEVTTTTAAAGPTTTTVAAVDTTTTVAADTTTTAAAGDTTTSGQGSCTDHGGLGEDKDHACSAIPTYCKLSCKRSPTTGLSECNFVTVDEEGVETDGAEACAAAMVGTLETFDYTTLNSTTCNTACTTSRDSATDANSHCRFWRWEWTNVKTCSFMTDAQCTVAEECTGRHCDAGEVGCTGEQTPAPTPEPLQSCRGGIVHTEDPNTIHWTCTTSSGGHLSPYDNDDLPAGAVCNTVKKCADWSEEAGVPDNLKRKLRVSCDGHSGLWTKWTTENTGGSDEDYAAVLGNGDAPIGEHRCVGGGTVLEVITAKITEDGAELMCTYPPVPTEGKPDISTITAPNSCILLCDYYLGMEIETELSAEGDMVFMDGDGNVFASKSGAEANVMDGSFVECWPERKNA